MRAGSKFFLIFLVLFVLSVSHCLMHETAVRASQDTEKELRGKIRSKPNDYEAHYNLGLFLQDLKRYEEAEMEYREAISLSSEDFYHYSDAHINLGSLLEDLKRYEEAEKEYRKAIRINPDYSEAHYDLGLLLHGLKRYEEAEKEYTESIRLNPNIAGVHANFGLLYKSINKKDEAKREFLIARELFEKQNRTEDVKKVDELLDKLK